MSDPFDLEQFKNGRDAITRDGRRAYFVGFDERSKLYPLVAHVQGKDYPDIFNRDGYFSSGSLGESSDLISLAPKTVTWQLWVRKYKGIPQFAISQIEKGSVANWCEPESTYKTEPEMLKEWTVEE